MKSKFSVIQSILFSILLLLTFSIAPIAQTVTGTIKGTVVDTNGGLIVGASVEVLNVETGLRRSLTTNEDGSYQATFLPLGRYSVAVNQSGFAIVKQENVTVRLNETVQVDISLDPSVRAEVVITDEPPPINTTNGQITSSLTSEQIQERPVFNQGNFLTLAETFTGFQENPTAGQNNPTSSSGSSVNFNGTGSRGATFQINGVNNDDSSENQNRQGASLATIKEFQIITNNFTAEFGRGYGAVVLVQTLSGTNQLRGSAYLYHNNSSLNAKRFFDHLAKPVNRRNQFGFTTGFPIIKNNLFGFVSFDRTKNSGANNYTRDVFLPSERNPANWFSNPLAAANNTPANRAFIQSVIDRFANVLPNSSRSPRTYEGQQGFDFPAEDYSGRFDWNPRQSDTVFARFQYTRQQFTADDIIIGERADQNNKQRNLGVTWTHIFNPQIVGEFRYGLGLRTTLVNIAAGNDTPTIRFFNPQPIAGSIIGNSNAFPIQRYQTDNQFVYNLSANLGSKHFFKAGTDIRNQKLDDLADNGSRGFYNFNASTCNGVTYGNGFAAFLNGCVNNFQKGYGEFFLENRIGEYNFYAEDNWRIFPNLTLNLGGRYEYVKAPREVNDKIDYVYSDDKDNIEPRIGFAYSPAFEKGLLAKVFGNPGESSIRGGYGYYHGRLFQSVFSQSGASVRTNTPNAFYYNRSGLAGSGFNPTSLQDPTAGFVFTPGIEPTVRYSKSLVVDPELEMPYTKQWNLTFERQLPWNSAVRISYTGNRGYGLLRYNFGNSPQNDPNGVVVPDHPNNAPAILYTAASRTPGDPRGVDVRGQTLRPAADVLCAGTGLPGLAVTPQCPVAVPLGALEYSFRVPRTNERRPDGRFFGNLEVSNGALTWYDGLQIEFTKRLSNGLNFQAAYTWSKSMDTTSEATFLGAGDSNQTGNDLKASKGLSRFHTPHRFTFFGTYRIPFLERRKDIVGQVFGGWQISTVFKWVHGTPFTVSGTGVDLNFDNFAETRPVILDPSILGRTIGNPNTSRELLPASAFRQAMLADLDCCILGRNTFYIDGVKNVDFALSKKFLMPLEGHSLTFRADLFNAFNWVQFGFPNTNYTTSGFGQINGTATQYAPRSVQFSLRYLF
ncbi:MAG: TonB-dependent receptor [Acidobacteriota bacterium]|nr:TonB-dependent receptor [Acidobacteriota bacterium]